MSDMRTVMLLGATVCLVAVRSLGAQAATAHPDSLLHRIQTLDTTLTRQFRALDSIRRSAPRSLASITVRAGPVTVRTTKELEPRVQRAAASVARLVAASGDSMVAATVGAHTPVVVPDSARTVFGMSPRIVVRSDTGPSWRAAQLRVPVTVTSSQLAARLAGFAEAFALQAADSSLSAWVMAGRVALRQPSDAELGGVYVELATGVSAAARRCQRGNIASCLDALGVDSVPGSRLDRWYTEMDYRAMLHQVAPPSEDSVAVAAWLRCRQASEQAACVVAATALPQQRIPLPLSASARLTFLRTVLDAGGPGSYDRLLASSGPIRERLASAANLPLDLVTRRWLVRIERARPERMRVTPALALASLGWCGALVAVALVRRGSWT